MEQEGKSMETMKLTRDERMRAEGAMNALDVAGERILALTASLAAKDEQIRVLREALAMLYDKWENGVQCFEACHGVIDESGDSLGNAFKLSFAEEQTVLNLIVEKAEDFERACANCNKPYRAHLLHDKNKCAPSGSSAWFPQTLASALASTAPVAEAGQKEGSSESDNVHG